MSLPLAHSTHVITTIAYLVPVVGIAGYLIAATWRERRRRRSGADEEPPPGGPTPPAGSG